MLIEFNYVEALVYVVDSYLKIKKSLLEYSFFELDCTSNSIHKESY
jgi:hypothetical protein